MNRILLAISLSLLASVASASGLHASDGPRAVDDAQINCPKPGGHVMQASPLPANAPAATVPAAAAQGGNRVAAVTRSGGDSPVHAAAAAPRIISPRWHSFLPGMFR